MDPAIPSSPVPTDLLVGAAIPAVVLAAVLALHLAVPARRVEGYARCEHTGELLRYRLSARQDRGGDTRGMAEE